jgi:hypothetical protein
MLFDSLSRLQSVCIALSVGHRFVRERRKRARGSFTLRREAGRRDTRTVPVGDVELTGVGNDGLDGLDLVLGQLTSALMV